MSSTVSIPENRVYLTSVSWEQYLAVLGDHEHDGRIAYNNGVLEIMTAGSEHESIKKLIARLLEHFTFVHDIDIHPLGNFTMKREELQKGIEADDCYYIQSIGRVRDFYNISLPEDPPPDLAIEIDVTNPTIDKLDIYAALGVAEVWRYRDGKVEVLLREDESGYAVSPDSRCLPSFPLAAIERALEQSRQGTRQNEILRAFAEQISND